ncbi:MAG: creatininase family protein [Halobacteriales archaeon]
MELATTTWVDAGDGLPDVALVPTGSVEQHGPHAPLGTDLVIARAVAARAATRIDPPVARTPAVPVGISEEHRGFDGTLWVEPDTFRAYVRDVVESLASHGVEGVVLVNGHGGNVAALEEVTARLTRDGTCRATAFTWFDALIDPPAPMGHGGPLETAALLAIDPDLVHADRLAAAAAHAGDRWGAWIAGTNLAVDVDEFSENGVVGDPRAASADRGEALLAEAVDGLEAVVAGVRERLA